MRNYKSINIQRFDHSLCAVSFKITMLFYIKCVWVMLSSGNQLFYVFLNVRS